MSRQTVSNVIRNPERVRPPDPRPCAPGHRRVALPPEPPRPRAAGAVRRERSPTAATGSAKPRTSCSTASCTTSAAPPPGATTTSCSSVRWTSTVSLATTTASTARAPSTASCSRAPPPGDPRVRQLTAERIPFVSFGRNWDDPAASTWVDVDGASGTGEAIRYFWAAGHRRIAWLGGIKPSAPRSTVSSATAARSPRPAASRCCSSASTPSRQRGDRPSRARPRRRADGVRVCVRPARPGVRRCRRGAWAEARRRARHHRLRRQPAGHRPPPAVVLDPPADARGRRRPRRLVRAHLCRWRADSRRCCSRPTLSIAVRHEFDRPASQRIFNFTAPPTTATKEPPMTPRRRAVTGSIAASGVRHPRRRPVRRSHQRPPRRWPDHHVLIALVRARRDPSRAGGRRRLAAGAGQHHPVDRRRGHEPAARPGARRWRTARRVLRQRRQVPGVRLGRQPRCGRRPLDNPEDFYPALARCSRTTASSTAPRRTSRRSPS